MTFPRLLCACPTLCDPVDCSSPGSSVHGLLQARTLEWVATPSSGHLPGPGIEPVSCASPALADGFLTTSGTREAQTAPSPRSGSKGRLTFVKCDCGNSLQDVLRRQCQAPSLSGARGAGRSVHSLRSRCRLLPGCPAAVCQLRHGHSSRESTATGVELPPVRGKPHPQRTASGCMILLGI